MNFESVTECPKNKEVSFQGYLHKNYEQLVDILGESEIEDGEKTDVEWWIQFEDGTFATIYNYKDGVNYNGTSGLPVSEITEWHIGGQDDKVLSHVFELFGAK